MTAKELSDKYIRKNSYLTREYDYQVLIDDTGEELTALIKADRAATIEECKAAFRKVWLDVRTDTVFSDVERALDALKEAQPC
jgi:hypothetical protein